MRRTIAFGIAALLLLGTGVSCAPNPLDSPPVDTNQALMPKSYKFSPPVIRVKPGTTVTWRNEDNFIHSVFVPAFGLAPKIARPGESVQITFDKSGEYPYVCSYHPNDMKGKVIVTAEAESTPSPSSSGY